MDSEVFENLRLELRRGSLTLAVLAQLRTERYGYILRKVLADCGLAIDENTLYPLLRRLEAQGLLTSHWREEEKRNKRYRLSERGEIVLYQLLNEHEAMSAALDRIVGGNLASRQPDPAGTRDRESPELSDVVLSTASQFPAISSSATPPPAALSTATLAAILSPAMKERK